MNKNRFPAVFFEMWRLILPLTIVGAGRVGTFLAGIHENSILVERFQKVPDGTGPIVVCTRNDDLLGVLKDIPEDRHCDLVFVQNGMLASWLDENGLSNATQALLYFAISKKGDVPVDGGGTLVTGPHATRFKNLLQEAGIAVKAVDSNTFKRGVAEKYLWNCIFGVLCQAIGCTVGQVVAFHSESFTELADELGPITAMGLGIELNAGWPERLVEYALSISDYEAAVKEWPWRNGWLWEIRQSPVHKRWLDRAGIST